VSPETVCTVLVAGAAIGIYVFYRQRYVGGCDSSAYLSESYLLRGQDPGLRGTLSPARYPALVPLCHELAGDRIVGIFPLGYPAMLAVFGLVGAESLVNPALAALSTWLMYLAVVPIAGRRVGCALSLIWCTTPLVAWAAGRMMSDLAAATGLLGTFVLLSRGAPAWAGAALAAAVAIRPTNLLFGVPAIMWTRRTGPQTRARFWLSAGTVVLAWAALELTARRSALHAGYVRGNLDSFGLAQVLSHMGFFGAVAWKWLWPIVMLGAVGVGSRPRETAPLIVWAAAPCLFYALWRFELVALWQSRFVLPAYPAIFLLAAHGAAALDLHALHALPRARWLNGAVALVAAAVVAQSMAFSFRDAGAVRAFEKRFFDDSRRVAELVPKGSLVAALNLTFPLRFYGGVESFDYRADGAPALVDAVIADRPVYAAIEPGEFRDYPSLRMLTSRYRVLNVAPLELWPDLTLQRLLVEEPRADGLPWTVEVSAAQRMLGDVAVASDGRSPPAGSPWDAPGTVKFADTAASLTFALPRAHVAALSVLLDGNDEYEIAASPDGARFARIAIVPVVPRVGLQERVIALPPGAGPFLRLSPLSGDGSYSVAEITPIVDAFAAHHP